MKRTPFLILSLFVGLLCSFNTRLVNDDYVNLTNVIKSKNSDFVFENKLLLVTSWSSSNAESREMNKEALRVYSIYKYAKLKGGAKGVSLFTVSADKSKTNWEIAVNRDELSAETNYCDLKGLDSDLLKKLNVTNLPYNILYDSNGNEVARNITTSNMFKYFNSLITR